jgi:hypothetical protein
MERLDNAAKEVLGEETIKSLVLKKRKGNINSN